MRLLKSPVALWADIAIVCLGMWGVALFYQYVLGFQPCVLCIHVRLWITAILAVSLLAIVLNQSRWVQLASWLGFLGSSGALLERSWVLAGTERGWIMGSCSFDMNPGLPAWLPLHEWFSELFMPLSTCGRTPELMFGISMADGMMIMSGLFTLIAAFGFVVMFVRLVKGHTHRRGQTGGRDVSTT
ncbi:MAG: disulfide bond formation protein B [Halomonadaceae bacterium]|nr:disulfide bond formation protein B [Halomonadaceae bacterium]